MTPIIMLVGEKNSGKNSVADIICRCRPGSVQVAIADPMKKFCMEIFGFTEEQLWGPSELRSAPDPRFDDVQAWREAEARLQYDRIAGNFCYQLGLESALDSLQTYWRNLVFGEHLTSTAPNGTQLKYPVLSYEIDGFFVNMGNRATTTVTKRLEPRAPLIKLGTEWARKHCGRPNLWNDRVMAIASKLLGGGHTYSRTEGLKGAEGAPPANWVVITDGRVPQEPVSVKQAGGLVVKVVNPDGAEPSAETHETERIDLIPANRFDARLVNHKGHGLEVLESTVRRMMDDLEGAYSCGVFNTSVYNY
jgi:hypothetical protein